MKFGTIELATTAKAEERAARRRHAREQARLKMKAALGFARTGLGRAALRARAMLAALGAFGAALLALYPVAAVMAITITCFAYNGSATPV